MDVLVVGDGNCSFAAALAALLKAHRSEARLLATTFDSAAALASKYPEAQGFVQRAQAAGAAVLHDVDALRLHEREWARKDSVHAPRRRFQHVVFHHPHLGVEDFKQNMALLGHFLHSASQPGVLAPRGVVHVSLGGNQPADWRLLQQARRHGLTLLLETVR